MTRFEYFEKCQAIGISNADWGVQRELTSTEPTGWEDWYEVTVKYDIFVFRCRGHLNEKGLVDDFDIPVFNYSAIARANVLCLDANFLGALEDLVTRELEWWWLNS